MNLSVGIVGLPNVGKSTLFNALLKKQVANVANYPFTTLEPNKGVVEVPDERLPVLAKVVNTSKIVPAVVEFYDIAGLVRGASKGEGLGNQFLANIREVSVICHVVRFFEDPNVIHVDNRIDPGSDVLTINSELILADLQTLDKQAEPRGNSSPSALNFWSGVLKLRKELDRGKMAREVDLTKEEREEVKKLCLLTEKPVIYVVNISEKQISDTNLASKFPPSPTIFLSAKMEAELASLTDAEAKEYLSQYGLLEPGLNRLISLAYETLGLTSFLTAGEKEVRAWTIKKGTLAPQAAGVIHTDFESHFIKADIVPYDVFVEAGGWVKAREQGRVETVGKDYAMKEGEVVEFKVGV